MLKKVLLWFFLKCGLILWLVKYCLCKPRFVLKLYIIIECIQLYSLLLVLDLWTRLLKRPHFCPQPSDGAVKIFLWDVVRRLRSVEFYELPEPRPPLLIYDRFEHIDPDLGMIIEPVSCNFS